MKTFEQYDIDDEEIEILFLELAHLDELEIVFNFINDRNVINYNYNKDMIFIQDKYTNTFWITFTIWSKFKTDFDIDYKQVRYYFEDIINKYFGLKDYTIRHL